MITLHHKKEIMAKVYFSIKKKSLILYFSNSTKLLAKEQQ